MVVTRRGVRVQSSNSSEADVFAGNMEATPSANRRAARTVVQCQPQVNLSDEECSPVPQLGHSSAVKQNTRRAQSQSAVQLDSTHEADVSESESCCSLASDLQKPAEERVTRSRRKRALLRRTVTLTREADDGSEAESVSSSVSASQGIKAQRITRSQRKSILTDDVAATLIDEDNQNSEVDTNASVATRSEVVGAQRSSRNKKNVLDCAVSSKSHTEDTEQSGPESRSLLQDTAVRRTTRSRRSTAVTPIPLHLESNSLSSPQKKLSSRAKPKPASELQSCESEGFESGPSTTRRRSTRIRASARRRGQAAAFSDSGSESTDVYTPLGSPASSKTKGSPSSSRTGSGNSRRAMLQPKVTLTCLHTAEEVAPEKLKDTQDQVFGSEKVDIPTQTSQVTNSEALQAVNTEPADCASIAENIQVDLEASLMDVCQQDNTLTAEDADVISVEEAVELSPMQDIGLNRTQVMKLRRSNAPKDEKEHDKVMDTCDVDEISSQSVKVVLPESPETEKELEKDQTVDKHLDASSAQESDMDRTLTEVAVDDDVCLSMTEDYIQCQLQTTQTSKLLLLDSSEDEEEVGGSAAEESDVESTGSGGQGENTCLDDNEAGPSQPKESVSSSGLFVIDTRPGLQPQERYYLEEERKSEDKEANKETGDIEDDESEEFVDEEGDDEDDDVLFKSRKPALLKLSSSIDPGLKVKEIGGLYVSFDGSKAKGVSTALKNLKEQKLHDELLKKSVIAPDFEKKDAVEPYKESKKKLKLKHREEKEKTTGDGWFNMRAPELTEELKNDLKALKMRSAMDPKRFYKKNDREGFPKYFQVGTVVDNPVDFYHSRVPKKQRKRTIVEELLADAEFRSYNKKKYKEIIAEKVAMASGKKQKKKMFKKKKA